MNLDLTVTAKRAKTNAVTGLPERNAAMEEYTVADAHVKGSRKLVVASLRALADSIEEKP